MPSWLSLHVDRHSLSRKPSKRNNDSASPTKSPSTSQRHSMQLQRPRHQDPPLRSAPISGKLRKVKDGNPMHKRSETLPTLTVAGQKSLDNDQVAKNFTVGNVGAGGTLYLKPSRMLMSKPAYAPATPPSSSDGTSSVYRQKPFLRGSDLSGAWTPRRDTAGDVLMAGSPMPPLDMPHSQRRHRSYSYSSVHDRKGPTQHGVNEFELPGSGGDTPRQRRASSTADLPRRNLTDIPIPHYRLGTPRFSERGTAYLHYSMAASSTGVPSSVLSRAEYDKLFPIPPGQAISSFYSHVSGGGYLRPPGTNVVSAASRTLIASTGPSTVRIISPALFDKLEANLDDSAVVRYHPTSGRTVAATPARLIAQITSPQFLDYELLANFFLTFRCFMTCNEVLELLFARMRWAFAGGNDAGRIARVRTFVAIRHWILNYFVDDFMVDASFRQSFCDNVNDLANLLRQRPDGGGGDINIIGELKKCWRRTCALHWPVLDALEVSAHADVVPGGEPRPIPSESVLSLPLTIRPASGRRSVFEMTQIPLPDRPDPWGGNARANLNGNGPSQRSTRTSRTASIPASPASEESLEVLSCSVPFLRNLRPTARAREKPAPLKTLSTQGKGHASQRPRHGHKRSGSFNDALRDHRTPLSSPKTDNVELKDLPSFAITGGLIRGILLQPSTANVDHYVPVTPCPPGPELSEALPDNDHYFGHGQYSANGVRKFVGEVRRALSSRKGGSESPTRSVGSSGSESRDTSKLRHHSRNPRPEYQQLPGPSRCDILSKKVESAYQDAVYQMKKQRPEPTLQRGQERPPVERSTELNTAHERIAHDIEYYSEKPLPIPPRKEAMQPTTNAPESSRRARITSDARGSDVMDFGRLNSHVTTGSRSIVIVDATGGPQLSPMSGGLPSFSSVSTDMMPTPLFRDRNEFSKNLHVPRGVKGKSPVPAKPRVRTQSQDSALGPSDNRTQDLLVEPSTWELLDKGSRMDSRPLSTNARRSSSAVHTAAFQIPALPHQLRRQPGGDLKATNHVHELATKPQRRHSIRSLSTTSRSHATSGVYSIDDVPLGSAVLPEAHSEKPSSVSLIETLSSQPIIRPSFIAEAERLKSVPDDIASDGGIQDALLKLEGKIPSPSMSTFSGQKSGSDFPSDVPDPEAEEEKREPPVVEGKEDEAQIEHETQEITGASKDGPRASRESPLEPAPLLTKMRSRELKMTYYEPATPSPGQHSGESAALTETQGASIFHLSESGINSVSSQTEYPLPFVPDLHQQSADDEESSLTPIITKDTRMTQYFIPDPYPRVDASTPESLPVSKNPDSILDAESSLRYPSFQPGPWGDNTHPSFLLDDNETLSDISTQLSSWHEDDTGVRSFFFDDTCGTDSKRAPSICTGQAPPTPPSTAGAAPQGSPDRRQLLMRYMPQGSKRPLKGMISHPKLLTQTANQPFPRRPYDGPKASEELSPPTFPAHLPFVLAFESEVIAEQLTIIEKDALDDIDWKDLISLNWSQNPPDVRNWVDFVSKDNTNGIDVIIARFNLVVKWCVSEVLLTEVPSERARAITKYIHIASHCHRLHNYASMYQIILALLSVDLTHLQRTWSLVALREKQMLERLEKLCRPIRNFAALRQEMETAMPGNGIIPFIGLYTHDLMFNALKSSRIDSSQHGKETLINFERYQMAATIVKNLLRLIEASARYSFRPEPEALSRCLWIAALEDHEITARSRALEAA